MKITCIIVEDEPLALKRAQSFVMKTPTLNLLGSFENALEALTFVTENAVDLIFLDVQMDEMTGIDFLESAKITSQVILTTAYEKYALKGYELNVTDYLLKPYTYPRFLQAVHKIQKAKPDVANFIFVKSGYQLEKVFFDDILYIEGMGDYRRIHTSSKKIMTLLTFSELEQLLPSSRFKRVHKSFMVSIVKIESMERNAVIIDAVKIPISATYKDAFHQFINQSNS